MKKYGILSLFCWFFLSGCGIEELPEPRRLVGEWVFEEVRMGKVLDFCPDDITHLFQDKHIVFTSEQVYIKNAATNQTLITGHWESQMLPMYMGDEMTYNDHLTTHFSSIVDNHDFSWRKVQYSANRKRASFKSCQNGECYSYELRRVQ